MACVCAGLVSDGLSRHSLVITRPRPYFCWPVRHTSDSLALPAHALASRSWAANVCVESLPVCVNRIGINYEYRLP